MTDVRATVLETLKRLRKGSGVYAADLDRRVRPEFRALLGASSEINISLRDRVIVYLEELVASLPQLAQRVARITLNLPPAQEGENLQQRIARLAAELYCDERTARRRMDEAFELMATHASAGNGLVNGLGQQGLGWYVETLDVVLRLDLPNPEAIERHTIVATAQTLDQVTTSIDIPRHPDDPGGDLAIRRELMFGGTAAGGRRESSTNFNTAIDLSRSLEKGERHTFGLVSRIPPGQLMAPRYVYVPYRPCRYFTLLVRFHHDRLPGVVWKHDGVPHSAVIDAIPSGDRFSLNRANEVSFDFRDLISGRAYGLQWQ